MLILLTNDDGINSDGIVVLKKHLAPGHELCVIAPERERTCVAHAITLHKPLRIREVSPGTFATNGTPADCVYLGANILLDKQPDLVISGINTGPNMGRDVNYSGTVAAAKEGAFLGIPSLAISICAREKFLFESAASVTSSVIDILREKHVPRETFLNINIPNIPREKIRGFSVTRLGKRIYNDIVHERIDPRGGKYYWIGGNGDSYEHIEDSDFYAVQNGFVSITPLCLDTTDMRSIKIYQRYFRRSL